MKLRAGLSVEMGADIGNISVPFVYLGVDIQMLYIIAVCFYFIFSGIKKNKKNWSTRPPNAQNGDR